MKSKYLMESLNIPITSGSSLHPYHLPFSLSSRAKLNHATWPDGDAGGPRKAQTGPSLADAFIYTQFQCHKVYHTSSTANRHAVLLICYLFTILTFCVIPGTAGIDCFKCVSLNGNNPSCEDPFHNNYSVSILESPCMGGRKGRNGLFPATACIKLAGRYSDTGESMVVRTCAVDSGTLTLDTELARMSHCGFFYFDDRYVKGCLQSCDDADGCNGSSRPEQLFTSIIITAMLLLISSVGVSTSFLSSSVTTKRIIRSGIL